MERSLQEIEASLARISIFSRLPERSRRKLARLCVRKRYPPGAEIVREGAKGLGLFLITSGRVEVIKHAGDGDLTLAELGAGEVLGEIAIIDEHPRSATAVALEETTCLLLTRDSFQTVVRRHPEIAWQIVPSLAERLRDLQDMVVEAQEARGTDGQQDNVQADAGAGTEAKHDPPAEPERPQTRAQRWMQAPLGLLVGGAVGLGESAHLMETFLVRLAEESGLDDGRSVEEVLRRVPEGLLNAWGATLEEGLKVPGRVMRGMLHPLGQ